jgi:hypothetical protein
MTLDDWLDVFARRFSEDDRKARLIRIAQHWNGFENWLKWELADAVRTERPSWTPWVLGEGGVWTYGQFGVEYRYRKAPTDPPSGRSAKLVDFWVSAEDARVPDVSSYFELKTVFYNANHGKQVDGWRADFLALEDVLSVRKTLRDDVAGFASVLCAVGFPKAAWGEAVSGQGKCWERTLADRDQHTPENDYVLPIRLSALRRTRTP